MHTARQVCYIAHWQHPICRMDEYPILLVKHDGRDNHSTTTGLFAAEMKGVEEEEDCTGDTGCKGEG